MPALEAAAQGLCGQVTNIPELKFSIGRMGRPHRDWAGRAEGQGPRSTGLAQYELLWFLPAQLGRPHGDYGKGSAGAKGQKGAWREGSAGHGRAAPVLLQAAFVTSPRRGAHPSRLAQLHLGSF